MTKMSTLKEKNLYHAVEMEYHSIKGTLDKVNFKPSDKTIQSIIKYAKR